MAVCSGSLIQVPVDYRRLTVLERGKESSWHCISVPRVCSTWVIWCLLPTMTCSLWKNHLYLSLPISFTTKVSCVNAAHTISTSYCFCQNKWERKDLRNAHFCRDFICLFLILSSYFLLVHCAIKSMVGDGDLPYRYNNHTYMHIHFIHAETVLYILHDIFLFRRTKYGIRLKASVVCRHALHTHAATWPRSTFHFFVSSFLSSTLWWYHFHWLVFCAVFPKKCHARCDSAMKSDPEVLILFSLEI